MADPIDWTSLLSGGISTAGQLYGANAQAQNLADAGSQAAQMAQFRPVGVTTRFGKSGFNYDPTTGQLIGAGYQVAPDVAGLREGLLGMASTGLGQAQQIQGIQPNINEQARGLFNLGAQYVAQTPQAAAQQYMTQHMSLSKTKPSPGAGKISILQWPYCPRPPVCLMYLPSALDSLRIVSL